MPQKTLPPCALALLLPLALLFGCAPDAPPVAVEPGPPPNVLLLVIDCLRADRLLAERPGVDGWARPVTPTLNDIARESARFTAAIAQASWTRPSLPTILTGLYPSEHGLGAFEKDENGEVQSPRLADSVDTLAELLRAGGYSTALIGEQFQLAPRFGLAQGFEYYKNRAGSAANIHLQFQRWQQELKKGPFFAYLHYLEIHWPYCPPKSVRGTFDEGTSDIRWCNKWRELRDDILSGAVALNETDRRVMQARYDEELLALDAEIGTFVADLKARGVWDETLVVVTADHGEEFFEHGTIGHGHTLYDELVAVPLLIKPPARWINGEPGRVIDHVVELRSITPTILEAAGRPPIAVDAPSLLPWVLGSEPSPRPWVISELDGLVTVREGDLKLILDPQRQTLELYDLAKDPHEAVNLAQERRADVARLRGHIETWKQGLRPAAGEATEAIDAETAQGLKDLGYLD